ncbi:MAG: hypothetical protein KDG52_12985 [Rhodocyclaceae bacterium]|nr:hypothetical protein [Rhodocyclaceae bacterium]
MRPDPRPRPAARPLRLAVAAACLTASAIAIAETDKSRNLVSDIANAPIVADGDVAGAVTDLVVTLDRDLDPAVDGYHLAAGGTIHVRLPEVFRAVGGAALADVFSSPQCVPGNMQCASAVLLRGWPQGPIPPRMPPRPAGEGKVIYRIAAEDGHTLVFRAEVPIGPGQPMPRAVNPGIKQLHLILNGHRNPPPGRYPVAVVIQPDPDDPGSRILGRGEVRIRPQAGPALALTSAYTKANPRYLRAAPGGEVPVDYLLWGQSGEPLDGVTLEAAADDMVLMRRGERTVGRIRIEPPQGAAGHGVRAEVPSRTAKAPVMGAPAARLRAFLRAGDSRGRYRFEQRIDGGPTWVSYLDVE